MWRLSPLVLLLGCPVEPKDVQDQQEQQLPMQGDNMPPADGSARPNNQGNQQGNNVAEFEAANAAMIQLVFPYEVTLVPQWAPAICALHC